MNAQIKFERRLLGPSLPISANDFQGKRCRDSCHSQIGRKLSHSAFSWKALVGSNFALCLLEKPCWSRCCISRGINRCPRDTSTSSPSFTCTPQSCSSLPATRREADRPSAPVICEPAIERLRHLAQKSRQEVSGKIKKKKIETFKPKSYRRTHSVTRLRKSRCIKLSTKSV